MAKRSKYAQSVFCIEVKVRSEEQGKTHENFFESLEIERYLVQSNHDEVIRDVLVFTLLLLISCVSFISMITDKVWGREMTLKGGFSFRDGLERNG